MADLVFRAAVAVMSAVSFYMSPRIATDRVAMQWGFDGKPTWSASKRLALWGPVVFALLVRLLIWAASTYIPDKVHGAEIGLAMFSVIVTASHVMTLRAAANMK